MQRWKEKLYLNISRADVEDTLIYAHEYFLAFVRLSPVTRRNSWN